MTVIKFKWVAFLTSSVVYYSVLQPLSGWVLKILCGFDDLLGAFTGFSIQLYSKQWFIITKGFKAKSREKGHRAKFRENQAPTSESPFSLESHTMCLIPPASSYVNMCESVKHSESLTLLVREWWGPFPKSAFWDAIQGPTLQAGLSKDSSLRPAVLTLLHSVSK